MKQQKFHHAFEKKYRFITVTLVLTLIWIFNILVCEVFVFRFQEKAAIRVSGSKNVLIVSDPQLTDQYSYDFVKSNPKGIISRLLFFFSDLYMKKNFASIMARNGDAIHAIVFLGDMMDSGRYRLDYDYEEEYNRFRYIFRQPSSLGIPTYNVTGNHDIGFGDRTEYVIRRYQDHFGKLNYIFTLNDKDDDIQFVVINSAYLEIVHYMPFHETDVKMNHLTPGNTVQFRDETWKFVKDLANSRKEKKIRSILFSHIPLFRMDTATCGKYAETRSRPMRQGAGRSYQNFLRFETSATLLRNILPERIFSGDDHENCEFTHEFSVCGTSTQCPQKTFYGEKMQSVENTVGTFSWLQGTGRPSYGMITVMNHENITYRSVFLPRQMYIYKWYMVLLAITIPCLVISHIRTFWRQRNFDISGKTETSIDSEFGIDPFQYQKMGIQQSVNRRNISDVAERKRSSSSFSFPTDLGDHHLEKEKVDYSLFKRIGILIGNCIRSLLIISCSTFICYVLTLLYWRTF